VIRDVVGVFGIDHPITENSPGAFDSRAMRSGLPLLSNPRSSAGEWVDPRLGKTSFREWSRRWSSTTIGLKPKTQQGYESLLRAHLLPAFGEVPLVRIQPVDVREWVAGLSDQGLSSSRVRQAHQLLSMILKAAVESGYPGPHALCRGQDSSSATARARNSAAGSN